jgi:hypothetical protein
MNLFNEFAVDRITKYSGGIPRVINILGDHCLVFGYANYKRRIDLQAVNQAIEYLEESTTWQRRILSGDGWRPRRHFQVGSRG